MAWYSGYQHPYQGFFWTWSNEKAHSGIDLPASCGTPMTAILPGRVIIAGQYPCYGGQVSIQSTFAGVPIVYTYLHGSAHTVNVGDTVSPGQLIGYSNQPIAAACGSGCHIHFEVEHGNQAPYTGGPPQNSSGNNYPINPVPLLVYAATHQLPASSALANPFHQLGGTNKLAAGTSSTSGPIGPAGIDITNPFAEQKTAASASGFDWGSFLSGIGGFIANPASILSGVNNPLQAVEAALGGLGSWVTNPIRIVKLIVGVGLIGIALIALILPVTAPIAAGVTTAALGAPEAALPVAGAVRSVTHRRRSGEPRPQPAPTGQAVQNAGVSVQRSYTTRRLGRQQRAAATGPIGVNPTTGQPTGPIRTGPLPAQPSQPAQPAQPYTTTNPASGKRTVHVPMREPTEGPPGPGVQRMKPYTGPSIPSNPPRSRTVPAKPKAAYEAPEPARARTTTPLRQAPVTQPLPTSPGTGLPITRREARAGRQSLMGSYRNLRPGQSVVGIPRSQRRQSQMSIEELRAIPTDQLTEASKRRVKAETLKGTRYKRQRSMELQGNIDDLLDQFRQERDK